MINSDTKVLRSHEMIIILITTFLKLGPQKTRMFILKRIIFIKHFTMTNFYFRRKKITFFSKIRS